MWRPLFCGLCLVVALGIGSVPAGAAWTDGSNPIFAPAGGAYYPSVLYDADSFSGHGEVFPYKMWYDNGAASAVGLAASSDGLNWTVLSGGVAGLSSPHHIQVLYDPGGFGGTATCYRIWYWAQGESLYSINAIHAARSADGVNWTDDQRITQVGTTVITGNWPDWNYGSYGPIAMFYNASGSPSLDDANPFDNRFVMYYDGTTGGQESWGLAYSADGLLWKGYDGGAAAVLPPGGTGQWDATHAAHGSVVRNPNGTLDLWYSGGDGASTHGVGHATSPDGIAWTRDPANPILELGCLSPPSGRGCAGSWNASRNYTPVVLAWPGGCSAQTLKMWRTGADAAGTKTIGYASMPAPAAAVRNVPADYPTIQAAIDASNPGDTVQVAAGTFAENLVIDRPLELAGAGQGLTTIVPATSAPDCGGADGYDPLCAGASHIVLVQADCVTIRDLTLDGDNPGLTSGVTRGGADIDARNGIILNQPLGPFDGLTVHHTTVKNIYLRGIYAYNPSKGAIDFHDDTVDNVQGHSYYSIGIFSRYATGTVADNAVSRCPDAISANWSHGLQFLRNTVTLSGSGVHTDNAGSSAGDPSDLLEGNQVSGGVSFGGDPTYGVWAFNPYIPVTIQNNAVSGVDIGLAAHRQAAPDGVVLFSGNGVDGLSRAGSRGALVTYEGLGWGNGSASATFLGDSLRHCTTGLQVDQASGTTAVADVWGARLSDNGTGVAVNGGSVTVTLSDLSGNASFGVNNAGGSAAATCNWWGSSTGPAHAGNPGGTGSAVSDGVTYEPWNDTDRTGICNGCVSKPPAPAVTPPGPLILCEGNPISVPLTASASGGAYQWYRDASPISGATSATYTATAAGSYTVKVTVGGCASLPSNAVLISVMSATPAATFVDDGYAGLPAGTAVDWPYTGTGSHLIGCDAFATIQGGVNAVSAGGTVNIANGAYAENVVVGRTLAVAGQSRAGVVVVPALSNPNCGGAGGGSLCPGASNIFLVQADGVVIHDLTVDGDNPLLTSGVVRGGADLDARNGIITNHAAGTFTGLEVHDVTVRNIYLRGMYASSGGTFNFHHSSVDNVQGEYASIGIFAWYGPGTMANNTVTRCNDGISANHSRGTQFLNNAVSLSGSGIHTDNSGDGGGTPDVIRGNTVSDSTSGGYGIWTFAPYLPPTVEENAVTNCDIGLSAWGQGAPVTQIFRRNTVTGPAGAAGSVGAYITTDLISWGYSDISVDLRNNAISGFETGVVLTADPQSWNPEPWVSHAIDAVFYDNGLAGDLVMGTQGTYACDASANWWGTADAAAVKARANGGAIADFTPWMHTGTDTSADPGFQGDFSYLHVDDDSPQTGAKGRIQEGIDLVSGSTVRVEAGLYDETLNVVGRTGLLVFGADRDTRVVKPSALAQTWAIPGFPQYDSRKAVVRLYASSGIEFRDLTFDFDPVKGNNVAGLLVWDTPATFHNDAFKNMSGADPTYYSEITGYVRAPSYTAGARAAVAFTDNIFRDTGRLGLVTHDWVHSTITGNAFSKTTHDFGYAMEIGSTSTALIQGNTISGYDTPATDHSQSGGIYIENSFTGAVVAPTAKPVQVVDNTISGCQWGMVIGNEFDGYAGDVDIQVTLTGNTVQNAAIAPAPFPGDPVGGIYITDEDRAQGSSVTVTGGGNSVLNNGQTGIAIVGWGDADISVALSGETVTGHTTGIRAEDSGGGSAFALAVTESDLSGNAAYGVQNAIAGATFDARCDWWGTPAGPSHSGNPGGTGSASSDGVAYSPWAGTNTFDCAVKYAVPTRLVFTQQPTDTVVGMAITPAVALRAEDADGNLGYNFHGTLGGVTMAIGDNPGGGALSGTTVRLAEHGLVTFDDLSIDAAGTDYSLVASAGAPWTFAPESAPFDILLPVGEVVSLFMTRDATDPALVDLRFTDVGNYNYNLYISTSPVTHPFDVSGSGKKECAAPGVTPPSGGFREVLGHDPGLAGDVLYFLVTADFGKAGSEGPLGVDSGAAPRSATTRCQLP